jgi:hypothetical protein
MGSTLKPGLSSVYSLSIVPELPPAPADRVLEGLAFFTVSLWSAAARRRIAERGPPGGEPGRAIEEVVFPEEAAAESGPDSGPEFRGDDGRGEDCRRIQVSNLFLLPGTNETVRCEQDSSLLPLTTISRGGNIPWWRVNKVCRLGAM